MEIIDSLFHNFYVPPVIFALVKDEDGEDTRVCVDGKQRLTSIQKFFDGQVRLVDPDPGFGLDSRTDEAFFSCRLPVSH